MSATFPPEAWVVVHTAYRNAIDAAGATAEIRVRGADGALLSTVPLLFPCATIDLATGRLTFEVGARDEDAAASGRATTVQVCSHVGFVWGTYTCAAGTTPVVNTAVFRSLDIIAGQPVELLSFTIG
jgi:hypothetical protein